jgi:hypothetical protein
MADNYPAPKVPLGPGNAVDLDQLGGNNLITHVHFPGIDQATGGFIYPNWRGCTAQGEAGDEATEPWPIDEHLGPEGLPVTFPNSLLKRLDQGWVFYSYAVQLPGEQNREPESKRLFFYVGKRPSVIADLAVPQIRESHGLALDPDYKVLPDAGVMIVAPPYAAMAVGDKYTLQWNGFDESGKDKTLTPFDHVKEGEVGQPLTWGVTKANVMLIENGRVELSYSILYANGKSSVSAQQTLRIVAPAQPHLPKPSIKQHNGGPLDPSLFLEGATVQIQLYQGATAGDVVVLYGRTARAANNLISAMRVDPSTIDSGVLEFHLQHAWLEANIGANVELVYQYGRPGAALSGEPLALNIRKPLDLPVPDINDTIPEGEQGANEGVMDAGSTVLGTQVRVASTAGAANTVHVHWGRPGTPGHRVVTAPTAGDWQLFDIPANAIAMNMGAGIGANERLNVFYRVVMSGDPPEVYQDSKSFNLRIIPYPQDRYPVIQCVLAQGTGGRLSLDKVGPEGAKFELGRWAYIHEGQILNIKVVGRDVYLLRDHRVTGPEANPATKSISAWLSRDFLANQLGVGNKFKVSVTISFDAGLTHTPLKDSPELTLTA